MYNISKKLKNKISNKSISSVKPFTMVRIQTKFISDDQPICAPRVFAEFFSTQLSDGKMSCGRSLELFRGAEDGGCMFTNYFCLDINAINPNLKVGFYDVKNEFLYASIDKYKIRFTIKPLIFFFDSLRKNFHGSIEVEIDEHDATFEIIVSNVSINSICDNISHQIFSSIFE